MESPAEVNGYYSPQQNRIGKFIFFTEQEVLMQKDQGNLRQTVFIVQYRCLDREYVSWI